MMVDNDRIIVRAWREHLGLTQGEVSSRMGMSQSAYSQQEGNAKNQVLGPRFWGQGSGVRS